MLFDLRGRGRRGTVRVIYIALAGIFLLGFVGFGVGGGFGSSGILSGLTNEGSSGGGPNYSAQVKKYSKLTAEQPHNLAAWEKLIKAQFLLAGGEAYQSSQGVVTSKGKELFEQISQSWSGYIAQNPPKPNLELSKRMLAIYDEEGLDKPSQAVEVLQLVVAAEPTNAAYYAQLADYAYKAKNTRVGDLASEKAVSLAPASERSHLKTELAEIKANPSGEKKTETFQTAGKTYVGKRASNGSITATEVKTSSSKGGAKPKTSTGTATGTAKK